MTLRKDSLAENDSRIISRKVYALRALAIVCVVAAHCEGYTFGVAETLRALLGTIGVPVFLICSGYYFNDHEKASVFWKKKTKGIVVPWLVWGCLTYLIIVVLGGKPLSVVEGIRWISGYKTWLYYVPVILMCFLLFRICSKPWWYMINILLFICSIAFSYLGFLKTTDYFTLYQIVFNYSGFFVLGILIRKRKLLLYMDNNQWIKVIISLCFVIIGIVYGVYGKEIGYWNSILSVPFELLSFFVLYFIACAFKDNDIIVQVGKKSFFIYFVHMEIGIGLAKHLIFRWFPSSLGVFDSIFVFVKPIVIVAISFALCIGLGKLFELIKLRKYGWLLSI